MFNKRNAFIGWLVMTLGKPIAMRKARQAETASQISAWLFLPGLQKPT